MFVIIAGVSLGETVPGKEELVFELVVPVNIKLVICVWFCFSSLVSVL